LFVEAKAITLILILILMLMLILALCGYLVDGAEGPGAQHLDLLELCLLEDPQQRLVGRFAARRQGLHQLEEEANKRPDQEIRSTREK